jgi:hypothetical protein
MVANDEQPTMAPPELKEVEADRASLSSDRPTSSPAPSVYKPDEEEFKPGFRFYLAFATLSILTLMVALDGTSISVALPVYLATFLESIEADSCRSSQRNFKETPFKLSGPEQASSSAPPSFSQTLPLSLISLAGSQWS